MALEEWHWMSEVISLRSKELKPQEISRISSAIQYQNLQAYYVMEHSIAIGGRTNSSLVSRI